MFPDNIGHCEQCGKGIENADNACQAMGTLYHAACFTCHICGCSLKSSAFYYVSGFIYCEADFNSGGFFDRDSKVLDSCSVCHNPIADATLVALQRYYHQDCFACSLCHKQLANAEFCALPDNPCSPVCLDDYWRLVAPTCNYCSEQILPHSSEKSSGVVVAKVFTGAANNGDDNAIKTMESLSYHPHCVLACHNEIS